MNAGQIPFCTNDHFPIRSRKFFEFETVGFIPVSCCPISDLCPQMYRLRPGPWHDDHEFKRMEKLIQNDSKLLRLSMRYRKKSQSLNSPFMHVYLLLIHRLWALSGESGRSKYRRNFVPSRPWSRTRQGLLVHPIANSHHYIVT